ncbi:MAG: SRPBCC domain-containing protein [Polyangiaceae bacterium]
MSDAVDRETRTIRFRRTLATTREDVFDAWTRPERISDWWDPTGAPLVACSIDLRPGGAFRFENAGHSPPFVGTYRTVDRPSLLVFEAMGAVGTVSLQASGASTIMSVTITCPSDEHFEMFVKLGVDTNTAKTMDNLVAHVSAPRQRSQPCR